MAQIVTVGSGPGEQPDIWVTTVLSLNSVTAPGHYVQVRFYSGATYLGFIGKQVNGTLGFDLAGSGFQAVSGSLGTSTGTQGDWLFALHLSATETGTKMDLHVARSTELTNAEVDILDPVQFAHFATATVAGSVSFNRLALFRHNNTASFIDELRVGTSYEANIGRAGATPSPTTYTLTYLAGANGSISGTTPQVVNEGASGSEVTAVPAPGYFFARWSDARTDNPRTDVNVTHDVSVTANFVLCRALGVSMLTNTLTVHFEGTESFGYDVERSTNLTAWTGVATNIIAPVGGVMDYVEDPATNPAAFYRLKLH
jgi:hypothetical protein